MSEDDDRPANRTLERQLYQLEAFIAAVEPEPGGPVREANRYALSLTGLSAADVSGRPLAECPWFDTLPSSQSRVVEAIAAAGERRSVRREIDVRTTAHERVPWEFTFVPQLDDDGRVGTIIVSGIDATLRQQTEVEKNLQFLSDLGEATRELTNPAKIMEVTASMLGRHLQVSRAAYADVEDDSDRFTIRHDYTDGCDSSVGDYSLALFGERAATAMQAGETLIVRDVTAELGDAAATFQSIGIAAIVCCPLVKFGKLVAMMAVHQTTPRDWTASEIELLGNVVERSWSTIERARAQLLLRKKERQFEDLFEYAPDAILIVDTQGNIALVNKAAEQLFGYARHELVGQAVEGLVPECLHGLDAGLPEPGDGAPRESVARQETELRGLRKDGSEFAAEVSLSPIETDQGPMVAASVRDHTERNRLQAQLQQSLKMETIGQLAGGVAHDFNNVLTVIAATAELLLDQSRADDPAREDLGTILRACERAASVTKQLLALSRQQVLDPVVVDLNAAMKDMEPMLQRLIGEDIVVKFRSAPDSVTARVDRTQIDQVILNLALNSRDAMPNGGTLLLETANVMLDETLVGDHPDLAPGPHVLLSVSDTGCGMDEATRRRVFEPFFTTKPPGKGTGLGLSTVYGIVRQSGGGIKVYSEAGKGTTFKVFLPRVTAEKAGAEERSDTAQRGSETVLVIEDEKEIRRVATIMLEQRGYTVLSAESGAEALKQVEENRGRIDLVLSDVVMPGGSGPETVRRIRELEPEIRVLYMSGYAADLIARHGVEEDPQHFISKPFTLAELSRAVRHALDD